VILKAFSGVFISTEAFVFCVIIVVNFISCPFSVTFDAKMVIGFDGELTIAVATLQNAL